MSSGSDQDFVLLDDGDLQDYNEQGHLPQKPEVLKEIHDWLDPTAYNDDTSEYLRHLTSHVNGTGDWLATTDEYRRWHDSENESVLWIKAVPGTGKSVLAAHQRAHLSLTEKAPVLHFFFRQIVTSNRTPTQLVRDWIAQLLPYSPQLQEQLHDKVVKDQQSLAQVGFDGLWRMAQDTIRTLPRVYCFADALDEMSHGHDDFISLLVRLGDIASCKVFITSRPVPRIVELLRRELVIRVTLGPENMDGDISKYVDHRLDRDLLRYIDHRLKASRIRVGDEESRETIEELIRTTLRQKALGSFLYARLMMDNLLESIQKMGSGVDLDGIRGVLNDLPLGLSEMYDEMLRDHAQRTGVSRELQRTILQWVTHSERPLRLLELSTAIDFEGGSLERAKDAKSIVRTACGPLLEILPSEVVGPVHHSFTEYLVAPERLDHEESQPIRIDAALTHRAIAEVCIRYLKFVHEVKGEDKASISGLKIRFPFLKYAIEQWHVHIGKCGKIDPGLVSLLDDLLLNGDQNERPVWITVTEMRFKETSRLASHGGRNGSNSASYSLSLSSEIRDISNLFAPAHVAAHRNLGDYIAHLSDLGHDLNAKTADGRTPAHWAAKHGSVDSLEALSKAGAAMNMDETRGLTPLHLATLSGHARAIELLLRRGIDPFTPKTRENPGRRCGRAPRTKGETPVEYAVTSGNVETCQIFIRHVGARRLSDILFWAFMYNRSNIAQLVIDEPSFDVNCTLRHSNPLCMACTNRDLQCMRSLIARGALVERPPSGIEDDRRYFTPLHSYIRGNGDEYRPLRSHTLSNDTLSDSALAEGLNLLLDAGSSIEGKDPDGFSPLHHAQSNYVMASTLLERGADPTTVLTNGSNPLHINAGKDPRAMQLWVKHGLDINARNSDGHTPLIMALKFSGSLDPEQLQVLLTLGADPNVRLGSGQTPLHLVRLMRYCSQPLLAPLLAAGADVHARDTKGNTPLLVGEIIDRDTALLVQAGADLETRDGKGNSAFLLWAMKDDRILSMNQFGRRFEVSDFLDLKPNIFARNERGATALHLACGAHPTPARIEMLIDAGLSPKDVDVKGNTPFHYWTELKSDDRYADDDQKILQLLLKHGADPRQANFTGQTPLHNAVIRSDLRMIDFLLGPQCNSEVNVIDDQGLAPIHMAAATSTLLLHLLIRKGADPTVLTRSRQSVLHFAAVAGDVDAMAVLLSSAVIAKTQVPSIQDNHKCTALHYAARSGVPHNVRLLLDAGADPGIKALDDYDQPSITALDFCFRKKIEKSNPVRYGWHKRQSDLHQLPYWKELWSHRPPSTKYGTKNTGFRQCAAYLAEASIKAYRNRRSVPLSEDSETPKGRVAIYYSTRYDISDGHASLVDELLAANEEYEIATNVKGGSLWQVDLLTVSFDVYKSEKAYLQTRLQQETDPGKLRKLFDYLLEQDRTDMLQHLGDVWHALEQDRTDMQQYLGDAWRASVSKSKVNHWLCKLAQADQHRTLSLLRSRLSDFNASPQHLTVHESWLEWARSLKDYNQLQQREKELFEQVLNAPLDGLLRAACMHRCPDLSTVKTIVHDYGCNHIEITWTLLALIKGGQFRSIEIIEYLLQHGADANAQVFSPIPILKTLFDSALDHTFKLEVATCLLRNGADPNIVDSEGQSSLAFVGGRPDLVRLLLAYGADPKQCMPRPIIKAIRALNLEAVQLLMGTSADLNTEGPNPGLVENSVDKAAHTKREEESEYPLLFALAHALPDQRPQEPPKDCDYTARDEIVRALLKGGADPFAITSKGSPILHEALNRGQRVGAVLDLPGLDLERRDQHGRTLLLVAASHNNKAMSPDLRRLLEMGALIDAVDNQGRNVLHSIAGKDHDVLNEFLGYPGSAELITRADNTDCLPLHVAQSLNLWSNYQLLLDTGADATISDSNGNSVLHKLFLSHANHRSDDTINFRELVSRVTAAGVDINQPNNAGEPALMNLIRGRPLSVPTLTAWPSLNGPVSRESPMEEKLDNYIQTIEFLRRDVGMDIRARSANGQNALHTLAAHVERISRFYTDPSKAAYMARRIWNLLVEAGLDPWEDDDQQRSALDIAAASGNTAIMEMY